MTEVDGRPSTTSVTPSDERRLSLARSVHGGRSMFHFVAHARPGHLLWFRETEGAALFGMLRRSLPDAIAACVMPDHVHVLLPHADPDHRLGAVMSGYTRWRNRHRKTPIDCLWDKAPPPQPLPDRKHVQRTHRYIHLNPCREGLADDPLAWPFSTHRDALGLAVPSALRVQSQPERFHAYVSGDPTVHLRGTSLPTMSDGMPAWIAIEEAVASVLREPIDEARTGLGRRLVVQVAWVYGLRAEAVRAGYSRSRLHALTAKLPERGGSAQDPLVDACLRVVGDLRFCALVERDQRGMARWHRYRDRR